MKRGRKEKTIKNITFTMSVSPSEAETLLKHGPTLQKAIRNIIDQEMQKAFDEAIKKTIDTTRSLLK